MATAANRAGWEVMVVKMVVKKPCLHQTREHGHPPNSRPSLNVTESWGCRTTAVLWTAKCQDHEPRIRTYADQALKHAKSYESESKQAKVDGARQAVSAPRQRYPARC